MALKCKMAFLPCTLANAHIPTTSDEKNDKLKTIIRNKVDEYLGRAEKLKEYLARYEESRSRGVVGANGMATGGIGGKTKGGADDADDSEIKKLRAGLSSAL
jgi:vacuolar protein-sorting-associated protein 4